MKTRTIVALVATGIASLGALPVIAQQATTVKAEISGQSSAQRGGDHDGQGRMDRGDRGPAFLVGGCGDQAAERLEVALVRLSHRLALTAEQQPLFDAFKTAAISAQTTLEATCAANAPAAPPAAAPADGQPADTQTATAPDVLAMLKSGLTIEEARVTAAKSILPSFEALYASLTDAQKQALLPGDGFGPGGRHGGDDQGPGRKGQFGGPGRGGQFDDQGGNGDFAGTQGGRPRH